MKNLRAVIIGCGNIAGGYDSNSAADTIMTHAKAYRNNPNVELVGALDIDLKQGQDFCKRWEIPFFYSDVATMMKIITPEIVSICTPNETHFDIFNIVAEFTPRAILCEKPLALNVAEARKMTETCARKNIVLAVNYMRRWDKELALVKEKISQGEFGTCQLARVLYTKGVFHNASHGINLLQNWLGDYKSVNEIRVAKHFQNDLLAHFRLDLKNCSEVWFHPLDAEYYNDFEIDLHFSKARIRLVGGGSELHTQKARLSTLVPGSKSLGIPEITKGSLHSAMQRVVNNVVDVCLGRETLVMTSDEAVRTLEICEKIRENMS